MSGFTGICSRVLAVPPTAITDAVSDTIYSAKTSWRSLASRPELMLAKSYFPFLELAVTEAQQGDITVWVDGEVYNVAALNNPGQNHTFPQLLLEHYTADTLPKFLARVDGVFVALLCDWQKRQLLVMTDRYGLRPFYMAHRNNHLMMAPEVKCFAHFPMLPLQVRGDLVESFMALEHLLNDATWLEHVVVAAPATVYTYRWDTDLLTSSRYWSWSSIRRTTLSFHEAAEALAESLHRANVSRAYGDYGVGVALSGGLDSRAILAAVAQRKPVTYTFGIENSPDVTVARRVAALAGVKHVYYDMNVPDWLPKRFSGIWKTDGMLNAYHMHNSHLMDEIGQIMDLNLNGYLGDAVIGGSYLGKKGKSFLNRRIDASIAGHYYGQYAALTDPTDPFFDIDKIDPYIFYNRGRRMIGLGVEEAARSVPQRVPFMDVQLMDLAYSLPDEYRADSKVYNQALLLKYPEYYKRIPDANSGLPIAVTPSLGARLQGQINWLVYAVKYKLGIPTSYTDVYNWIKAPDTANMIRALLDPRKALYRQYTQQNYVDLYLTPHLSGRRNYMKQIMGAVTLEVWLQQLLNKAYRPER